MVQGCFIIFHFHPLRHQSKKVHFHVHPIVNYVYRHRHFLITFTGYCHAVSGFCGVHYVFRYNTRLEDARAGSGCGVDVHGPGYNECWPYSPDDTYNGGRAWEVYNNTFESGDTGSHNGIYMRSGVGVITAAAAAIPT